ncbi:MAG: nicotinate (nicotinamide) nucleotide adenylyltransferase [Polyangiaceae bacterium]|nr:nicotinate (nicotinamide) nucleotide adenylyltransferase [Polyangiaceae bacterium]
MDDDVTPADSGRDTIPGGPRVAIFGGSFNPPHVAHVLAVVYALAVEPVDEVLVVPVYRHPFSKELVPFEDRLAMCEAAMGWIPRTRVSAVERDLGGESLTLRLVSHLRDVHPDWELRLLVGADVLADLPKWHRFDKIAEIAPPIVMGRAGVAADDAPLPVLPRVSSTEVRDALARGDHHSIRGLLPTQVLTYIQDRGLYRRT